MATQANLIATYQSNPTLQKQYTQQQYLDLFDFGQKTPQPVTNPPPTRTPTPTPGVPGIINQNINQYQGGGGAGIPMVGSDGRIADFNESITARQKRLNNPNIVQSFISDNLGKIGINTQSSINEMMQRGMRGIKDSRLTSGIPLGISGMIAGALPDNYYDKMTLGDQILTQSYMGYTDPNTNMSNKDPFGINVRSAFGNYSEYAQNEVDKLSDIVKDQKKRGLTDTLQMKKLAFYNQVVGKKSSIVDALRINQMAKEAREKEERKKQAERAANIGTASQGISSAGNTAQSDRTGGNVNTGGAAGNMGGGSRQATSAGSTSSGRKDGGWGWKDGGRVYLYNRLK